MKNNNISANKKTVCLFFFLSASFILLALDPYRAIIQYRVQIWDMENGLLGNSVFSPWQTQDGYPRIGTQDGLVRFDGLLHSTVSGTGN